MEHTPTPWTFDGVDIRDSKKELIALLYDTESGNDFANGNINAAFIVRAVNCHEELVKVLQEMLGNYLSLKRMSLVLARSDSPDWMPGMTEDSDIYVIAARKAIAKAEAQ